MNIYLVIPGILGVLLLVFWLYAKGDIGVNTLPVVKHSADIPLMTNTMPTDRLRIQHLRHATLLVAVAGKRILVDPMLAAPGTKPPVPLTRHRVPNPRVHFPVDVQALNGIDAVLITHLHGDHFDDDARQMLPKDLPILCQPSDENKIRASGFQHVIAIATEYAWETLTIFRVEAHHGTGRVTALMGTGSGYMIRYGDGDIVYIAGDTIYDETFEQHLVTFAPKTIIVNAGAARMLFGGPITMTSQDVRKVCAVAPHATVIAVHMDAINHCSLSRERLQAYVREHNLLHRVRIPQDGEIVDL